MQKDANNQYSILFTQKFVTKFKKALQKTYLYEDYMDFVIVPSVTGKKILCYLPFVNYTNKNSNDTKDLIELAKENDYQIRVLNFDYTNFIENDTVTMRIEVENYSGDEVFMNCLKKKCRTKIRKSLKNSFTFKYGNEHKDIDDFHKIFSSTMYMHGTPVMGKKFFISLLDEFKDDIIFYSSYYEDQIAASYCVLFDEDIAWVGWGGIDMKYRNELAGYFTHWQAIKHICDEKNVKIFDFGRSPYNGGTYKYKSQFGAKPVKIDIITSQKNDIYSKYSLASDMWKKLPKNFVDFLGPKLCKYLVDL